MFNPPYITQDQFTTKPYAIGTIASSITEYQLYMFGLLLKDLESSNTDSQAFQYLVGIYLRVLNRAEKQDGLIQKESKQVKHLRDIIDNTLDDLEVIYKDTGLDSVGNLIDHMKNAKNEGVQ